MNYKSKLLACNFAVVFVLMVLGFVLMDSFYAYSADVAAEDIQGRYIMYENKRLILAGPRDQYREEKSEPAEEAETPALAGEDKFALIEQIRLYDITLEESAYLLGSDELEPLLNKKAEFVFYQDGKPVESGYDPEQILIKAAEHQNAYVTVRGYLAGFHMENQFGGFDYNYLFGTFNVYQGQAHIGSYSNYTEAVAFASFYAESYIIGEGVVWTNLPEITGELMLSHAEEYYINLTEAIGMCPKVEEEGLYYIVATEKSDFVPGTLLWQNSEPVQSYVIEGVPFIKQNPQLPRGCEVTSLAMVLNYHDIGADKMVLAEEVRKAPERYDDPNNGFVGDMYALDTHGLGVYHSPIAELAETYAPERVLDITGCDFESLYYYIENDMPVWIINNSRFAHLPESEFFTWNTPNGPMKLTQREHSVVITGFDDKYIYFNDPLVGGYRKVNKKNFIDGWIQMGQQAVIILS